MRRIGTSFWKYSKYAPVSASTADYKTSFMITEKIFIAPLYVRTVSDYSGRLLGLELLLLIKILTCGCVLAAQRGMICFNVYVGPFCW